MGRLVFLCGVFSTFYAGGCSSQLEEKAPVQPLETREEEEARIEREHVVHVAKAVADFESKHQAQPWSEWTRHFEKPGSNRLTIQIQNAVSDLGNEPVVLAVEAVDLFRKGDGLFFVCVDVYGTNFLLSCSREVAETVLGTPVELIDTSEESDGTLTPANYLVLAKLKQVSLVYERHQTVKVPTLDSLDLHGLEFTTDAYGFVDVSGETEHVEQQLEENALVKEGKIYPIFNVHGECLDAATLRGPDGDWFWLYKGLFPNKKVVGS